MLQRRRAVLAFGFKKMKLHRIIATCQPENMASHRVMEKIGMRREGFLKMHPHDNEWWDEYYYAVLEEEWEAPIWNKRLIPFAFTDKCMLHCS